jgi:hypothetical protein
MQQKEMDEIAFQFPSMRKLIRRIFIILASLLSFGMGAFRILTMLRTAA